MMNRRSFLTIRCSSAPAHEWLCARSRGNQIRSASHQKKRIKLWNSNLLLIAFGPEGVELRRSLQGKADIGGLKGLDICIGSVWTYWKIRNPSNLHQRQPRDPYLSCPESSHSAQPIAHNRHAREFCFRLGSIRDSRHSLSEMLLYGNTITELQFLNTRSESLGPQECRTECAHT